MIGICIITHGKFAEGIKNSAEMIVGDSKNIEALGLYKGQVIEDFQNRAFETIKSLEQGDGVLVFVDMFGATPFNTIAQIRTKLIENKIKCGIVTGLNLPMLVEVSMIRDSGKLEGLLENIANVGKDSISVLDISMSI